MEIQIDRYPVSELLARYSVGKSKLYADYLGQCKVVPVKIQGRAYVTVEDLKRLDDYHVAEGKGKDALAQFIGGLTKDGVQTIISDNRAFSLSEMKEACSAITLHYATTRLSQKMLLTIEEAAMVSGLSKAGIRLLLLAGDLPAIKEGGRWKIRPEDLRECITKKIDKIALDR